MADLHIKVIDVPNQDAWTAELWTGFPGSPGTAKVAGGQTTYTRAQLERDDDPVTPGGSPLKLTKSAVLKALREDEQVNPIFARTGLRLFELLQVTGVATEWKRLRVAGARTFIELPESIAEWPWETLRQRISKDVAIQFFYDPNFPILRVHSQTDPAMLRSGSIIRILLISGQEILDAANNLLASQELREIREAFHKEGLSVLIDLCPGPSSQAQLQEAIQKFNPHIIHFIGHGEQGPDSKYQLVFEGGMKWTSSEIFNFFQAEAWKPRLVVLNACHGSKFDLHAASVAEVLLNAGVPAVVGALAAFRVDYARQFAKAFYQSLAKSRSLEKAITIARRSLAALAQYAGSERRHWALPVLTVAAPPENILQFKDANPVVKVCPIIKDVYKRPGTFVDRVSDRWSILSAMQPVDGSPGVRGVIVNSTGSLGKTWLMKRSVRDFLDAGYLVRYAELAAGSSSRTSIDVLLDWRGNPNETSPLLGPIPAPHFDAFDAAYTAAKANPTIAAIQDVFRKFKEGLQSLRNGQNVLLIIDQFRKSGFASVGQTDFRNGLMTQLLLPLQESDPSLDGVYALLVVGQYATIEAGAPADEDEFALALLHRFKKAKVGGFQKSQVDIVFDEFSDFSSDEAASDLRSWLHKKATTDGWSPTVLNIILPAVEDLPR